MNTTLTRRNALQSGLGAVALAALAGCANQQQSGTPTTQPSGEQTAYDIASGIWTNITAAAAIAEAVPGLIPPPDVALIDVAVAEGNKALATWHANLGQPAAVTLQAEFYALLPDIARIIADAKAKKAGTTVAALRAKAMHR